MFNTETKRGLKKGDPDAYKEVFRLLYPRLKGYCLLFMEDPDEVEDIIQESFISLWEKRSSIDSARKIESLMFVMVRNRCLNYLKSKKIHSDNIQIDKIAYSELQHLYQLDLNDKEEKSLEELLIISFQEAVANLPPKMKDVFVQCKLEGRKQKDVAHDLGISVKMVEKHIARAKELIVDHLKLQYPSLVILITGLIG